MSSALVKLQVSSRLQSSQQAELWRVLQATKVRFDSAHGLPQHLNHLLSLGVLKNATVSEEAKDHARVSSRAFSLLASLIRRWELTGDARRCTIPSLSISQY